MLDKLVLSNILIITKYTFREVLKSKVLVSTLLIGLGLLGAVFVAYSFTYGEPSRVALDFGLGTLSLSSIAIAIFMGVGIVANEIESRTVYLIISRPIPRFAFLIGKLNGLALLLVLNILILSLMTLSLYFVIGGNYQPLISWSIVFITLESIMMLVLVTFLSLVSSKVFAVIFSIALYVVGHAIDGVKSLTMVKESPFLKGIISIYHYILPAFYKLNLKEYVLYNQNMELSYLLSTFAYGVIYTSALVLLSIFIFERKNLD